MIETEPQRTPRAEALAARIDRLVRAVARHWLFVFNLLLALYLVLPVAAPILMESGHTAAGGFIYLIFRPQCHQLPERSFFLFGESAVYSLEDLEAADVLPGTSLTERARFTGNDRLGYKIAFCERDLATWAAILLAGLLFGITGRRWRLLPLWGYALFLIPMAADGISQLLGWRESDWTLRTISGLLFGFASVWLAYPHVEMAMSDVTDQQVRRSA
ncbi:MAG TPA: DUF2085 domain-containing protein [Anaerolineae bacterium]|nr:DUF2085 domain-containing protein [Anaerolineae bacterium]